MFKKRNEKGFTLMEMLIVVAIIAILVAISIPIFTSQLDKAKTATDDANVRAAKAVAVAMYLTESTELNFGAGGATNDIKIYDAANGKLVDEATTLNGYGKAKAHDDMVIQLTITPEGAISAVTWVADGVD